MNKPIKIANRLIGLGYPPFIIAEMSIIFTHKIKAGEAI